MPKKYRLPKKRGHKGLKIFAILMTIFVVFPIAFVFAAFFDTSTKKVSDSELHYQNIVSEALYNGVKDLDDGILNFTIDENMIDGIMASACGMINQKKFIPKMYCYINDNNYTFAVDLQASFFKSRVLLHTSLEQTDQSFLTFKIKGITIGRLPIPINWVTGIASNFVTDEMLDNVFAKTGFHIKSHLAEAKLTYSREQLKFDVGAYIEDLGKNNPFLVSLLSVIGDEEVLKPKYSNGITASFDLKKLSLNESPYVTIATAPIKFDENILSAHKQQITTWLNSDVLSDNERVGQTFSYLIRGYDDGSKVFIDEIAPTPLGEQIKGYLDISDLKTYKGSNAKSNTSFQDYCNSNIGVDIEYDDNDLNFSFAAEDNESGIYKGLNPYMAYAMTSAIGQTIPITYKSGDAWNFEYVLVDNIYVGFTDEESADNPKLVIFLQFNISNKFNVTMTVAADNIKAVDMNPVTSNPGKLQFDLEDIYFGKIPFTDPETRRILLDLLPKDSEPFTFDSVNNKFNINLDIICPTEIKGIIAKSLDDCGGVLQRSIDADKKYLMLSCPLITQ